MSLDTNVSNEIDETEFRFLGLLLPTDVLWTPRPYCSDSSFGASEQKNIVDINNPVKNKVIGTKKLPTKNEDTVNDESTGRPTQITFTSTLKKHVGSPVYPSLREDEEQYAHSRRVTFYLLIEGEPFLLNFDMNITTRTNTCRLRLVDVTINGNRKFRKSPRHLRAINYSDAYEESPEMCSALYTSGDGHNRLLPFFALYGQQVENAAAPSQNGSSGN